MDRRRFLEITGAAAAAALTGCGGGGSSPSASPAPAPVPVDSKWSELIDSMQGKVLTSGDSDYASLSLVVNGRFNNIQPQAIARCVSSDDVIAALAFAQKKGYEITPRCGGHNYAGYSTNTGMVIDVRPMNAISVNGDGTATIGAGATLADVYDQLTAQGRGIPTGTCPTVGIAGITMGGGISLIGRKYGLTCDSLLSAEVVTADGRLLVCDATHEPDLFWALRGGGGGNFGIATSFTYRTHPADDLVNFTADFQFSDADKVFAAWQAWPQNLPDEMWGSIFVDFTSSLSLTVTAIGIGTRAALEPYWNDLLAATNSTPVTTAVFVASYRDTMLAPCWSRNFSVPECHLVGETATAKMTPDYFVGSSDFFNDPLPPEGIQAMLAKVQQAKAAGLYGYLIFDLMKGALAAPASADTAFFHRAALFSAEYWLYIVQASDPVNWANEMRNTMAPWSSGGAYVNYMDPLISDWQNAYYGSNYARLQQVKAQYDPGSIFHLPRGIVPG